MIIEPDLTTIGLIISLAWCGLQEYRINRICEKCPFLPRNANPPIAK